MSWEMVGRCTRCDVQWAKEYGPEVTLKQMGDDVGIVRKAHERECPGRINFVAALCDRSIGELLQVKHPA